MGIIGVFFLLIRLYFQILKTVWVFWDFFAKGFVIIQLGIFAEVPFFFFFTLFLFFCSLFYISPFPCRFRISFILFSGVLLYKAL